MKPMKMFEGDPQARTHVWLAVFIFAMLFALGFMTWGITTGHVKSFANEAQADFVFPNTN